MINDNGFIIGSCMEGTDYQIEGTGISRRHLRFYKEGKISVVRILIPQMELK